MWFILIWKKYSLLWVATPDNFFKIMGEMHAAKRSTYLSSASWNRRRHKFWHL
jgi:hypothetical protein